MKKNSILIALALFSASGTWAEELPKDTLKVIDVEEIVVIAAPKENRKLREQPTAVTMLSQHALGGDRQPGLVLHRERPVVGCFDGEDHRIRIFGFEGQQAFFEPRYQD